MTIDVVNQNPYLRTSRNYPPDIDQLSLEVNKTYIDIANAVNNRTISIFPTTRAAITGESWFLLNNRRQQSLRQVYTFVTTADIQIGFKISSIDGFSKMSGVYTDILGNWYGLIPATSVVIPGQISFFIFIDGTSTTTDLIRFVTGAGAPALTSGRIVLEWLSFV